MKKNLFVFALVLVFASAAHATCGPISYTCGPISHAVSTVLNALVVIL